MARPQSEGVKRALELVAQGVPPYRAAIVCGLSPSTVYRARKAGRRLAASKQSTKEAK